MPFYRPVLCYDASALNRLVDDFDTSILQAVLTLHFYSRITSTNFEEIAANRKAQRRELLLDVTEAPMPFHMNRFNLQRKTALLQTTADYNI